MWPPVVRNIQVCALNQLVSDGAVHGVTRGHLDAIDGMQPPSPAPHARGSPPRAAVKKLASGPFAGNSIYRSRLGVHNLGDFSSWHIFPSFRGGRGFSCFGCRGSHSLLVNALRRVHFARTAPGTRAGGGTCGRISASGRAEVQFRWGRSMAGSRGNRCAR
jgi:hypothetical protein